MIPIDVPLALPVNLAPMLGQMEMGPPHVLGLSLAIIFVVAASAIAWKISKASRQRPIDDHAAVDRRDLDQAA